MRAIFIARGHCTLGRVKREADGSVTEISQATFEFAPDGGSVAIGPLDAETGKPKEIEGVYGDWDAAGYLSAVLKEMAPNRTINIPDFEAIIKAAYAEGNDLVCDYCQSLNCPNCIVREWKDE